MTMRTALVRTETGNLKAMRYDDYRSNAEMADDLRGNGYKVLKVWKGWKTDAELDQWETLNRKSPTSPPGRAKDRDKEDSMEIVKFTAKEIEQAGYSGPMGGAVRGAHYALRDCIGKRSSRLSEAVIQNQSAFP